MSIPPKWLREKIKNSIPLSKEELNWLHKEALLCKGKEELVDIILKLEHSCKEFNL